MKTYKWLGATGAIVALSAAGFVAAPSAQGSVTLTAGAGSSVTCHIAGTAKLAPALANDWPKASHQADAGNAGATSPVVSKDAASYTGNATIKAAMASIPNTTYAANNGAPTAVTTSAKVASISCSGNVHDTTLNLTDAVTSATITASSITGGTDEATCSGLASPGTSTFSSIIAWKGTADKINPTTVVSSLATLSDSHGTGFELDADGTGGTSITGSFSGSGGTSTSKAYVDGTTIVAILSPKSSTAANSPSLCEATVSGKFTPAAAGLSDAVAIKLKKPKGLKAISIGNTSLQGCTSSCVDSTLAISR